MTPTPEILRRIEVVRQYAESHIVPLSSLTKMMEGVMPPVGDKDEHTVMDRGNFKAVFSIAEQPAGVTRHLSVSVSSGGVPDDNLIYAIAKGFGFKKQPNEFDAVWREEYVQGAFALNVLEVANDLAKKGQHVHVGVKHGGQDTNSR